MMAVTGWRHVGTLGYLDAKGRLRPKANIVRQLLDQKFSRTMDVEELGTDGLRDHSMDEYLALVEQSVS